jgi:hypothetical protein
VKTWGRAVLHATTTWWPLLVLALCFGDPVALVMCAVLVGVTARG